MRQLSAPIAATLIALASAPAAAGTWELDPAHTSLGFSVKHMVFHDVRGSFGTFKGTVNWDEKDITKSTLQVEADAASINTMVQKRDDHLRSPDFFDVTKFPTLTFKSTKIEKAGQGLKITGDLTMHGVTRSVVLDSTVPTAAVKGPWGNVSSAVKATGKLNRKDFGLNWNKTLEAGGLLVGEEITLNIEAELVPQQPIKSASL